ncbi:MAG: cyclopropane fatty acyl phospholipid synthase [Calditrichaceae bacterium]
MNSKAETIIRELLETAGIEINGHARYDIAVHDDRFYKRVLDDSALGMGESYMDAWWDCDALDEFFYRVLSSGIPAKIRDSLSLKWHVFKSRLFNLQNRHRAYQVGIHHYDIGNDLFRAMLDKRMNYSCAYWKNADNLDYAQEAKLDMICKKIDLRDGMIVLDIGCGWGAFAKFAAEKYGASVTGITVSKNQHDLGKELCRGLPVEIRMQDYRAVKGLFDRVISIGSFEHIGYKNHRTYMEVVDRTLKDDGIAFVQTIGQNKSSTTMNPWSTKYIFPNGLVPSVRQIGSAAENLFVMEDWHNFGPDYDKTLMAWHKNFTNAWPELSNDYDDRFERMWRYYLLSSAAGFRSRENQLWQIVLTKTGRHQPESRYC